jgi:hypothetical protein
MNNTNGATTPKNGQYNGSLHPEDLKPINELLPDQKIEVPETPEKEAAQEHNERDKGYFATQSLSKYRVRQTEEGSWVQLTDSDLSQERAAHSGGIYESVTGRYWITSAEGNWIKAGEKQVKNYLQHDMKVTGSESTAAMNFITRTADIEYASPMAGYSKGIYSFDDSRVLVTNSPRIIRPVKGAWPTINRLLTGMLGLAQLEYFYGWAKHAYESLATTKFQPGQMLVFGGPKDTGKSFVQAHIITPLLGGRQSNPYQYMTGMTTFNGELFKAEHLAISDEMPATEDRERLAFGNAIKKLVSEEKHRLHAKNREGVNLTAPPFWRVTMSVNDEPEDLMQLPHPRTSMLDKLMVFYVGMPDCLPDGVSVTREMFAETIRRELPAFVYFLANEHEIRRELIKSRFGIQEYFSPAILDLMAGIAPEENLMGICEAGLFPETGLKDEWEGTATELSAFLKANDSLVSRDATAAIKSPQRLGSMLKSMANNPRYKSLVTVRTLQGTSRYRLFRRYQNRKE